MENSKSFISVGGTSFCNLLFLTFLVLKLTNVINWSWWWVTAPLWMPFGIVCIVLLLVFVVGLAWAGCENSSHKRYR